MTISTPLRALSPGILCTLGHLLQQHSGCCWLKFETVEFFHATFVDVA